MNPAEERSDQNSTTYMSTFYIKKKPWVDFQKWSKFNVAEA